MQKNNTSQEILPTGVIVMILREYKNTVDKLVGIVIKLLLWQIVTFLIGAWYLLKGG